MMYEELIKALRCCGNVNTDCTVCPLDKYNFGMCAEKLYTDAAAAIEALQAEIRESMQKCAECGDRMVEPKRGEWEREMDVNDEPFYQCSVCGECFDFNSDSTHEVFNYCPNCGADMRKMEVQE